MSRSAGIWQAVLRFVDRVGRIEIAIVVITTGVCLWSWLAFVVIGEPDFVTFTIVYGIALATGGVFQNIMAVFVRPPGSLRARLSWDAAAKYDGKDHNFALLIAPVLLSVIFFLLVTPPSTPVDSFDRDMVLYQVIGLMAMLGFLFTYLGALLIVVLIVMPIALLIAAFLPVERDEEGRPLSSMFSTSELVILGSILLSAVGFAVSIARVIPQSYSGFRRERMSEQFVAFVTFTGEPAATTVGWFFVAALIVLVIVHRLLHMKRKSSAS